MTETAIKPEEHLGLAWSAAMKFADRWYGRRVNLQDDDIVSEAFVALLHAAKAYRPDRGVKFSTYATRAIKNALWDWVAFRNRPVPCKHGVARHCVAIVKFRDEHGRDPTREELARLINRPIKQDKTYQRYLGDVEFFQASVSPFSMFLVREDDDEIADTIIRIYRYSDRHHNGAPV